MINLEKAVKAFESKGYLVKVFDTKEDAAEYLDMAIDGKIVGFGDSATLLEMELFRKLREHNVVFDPFHTSGNMEFVEVAKKTLTTDVFLTSVNAFAETGELVNIDGTGNRVAGSLFGHKKVYFVMGINKGEETLEKAMWRARNIAAPQNAKRLGLKTPCAVKGDKCYDCNSDDCICNAIMVHRRKMRNTDEIEIVIIKENLGM